MSRGVAVVGWVGVCVSSQEDLRIALALQSIDLILFFFVKQPLRKATEFVLKLLAHLSAILLFLAGTQAYN